MVLRQDNQLELTVLPESKKAPLEKFGYNVITANSAEKAVELFEGHDEIELVLMDIELGKGMDGALAAAIILDHRELPILFLSSHTEPEVVERTEKITSYGYVVKNSSITVLDASIKIAHHSIKNSMNTLRSLLQLQSDCMSDPGAIAALADTDGRLVSMTTLYDKLYRSVEYSDLSIKDYLQSLVVEVLSNFPKAGLIRVEKLLDDFRLDAKVIQSGLIRVSASIDDNLARIIVADDGTGVPDSVNFDNSPGFGLMLVRTLTEQIGGTITMDRTNGTVVTIVFKV